MIFPAKKAEGRAAMRRVRSQRENVEVCTKFVHDERTGMVIRAESLKRVAGGCRRGLVVTSNIYRYFAELTFLDSQAKPIVETSHNAPIRWSRASTAEAQ